MLLDQRRREELMAEQTDKLEMLYKNSWKLYEEIRFENK
jgi:hypothetical protein